MGEPQNIYMVFEGTSHLEIRMINGGTPIPTQRSAHPSPRSGASKSAWCAEPPTSCRWSHQHSGWKEKHQLVMGRITTKWHSEHDLDVIIYYYY